MMSTVDLSSTFSQDSGQPEHADFFAGGPDKAKDRYISGRSSNNPYSSHQLSMSGLHNDAVSLF